MTNRYAPMKSLMESLIRRAGEALLGHFRENEELLRMRTSAKEAATGYDKIVDRMLIEELQKAYPGHSILSEEGGRIRGNDEWWWVIDSLDGTGNFANWNPFFAVCLALVHSGELVLGSVYAPAIDEFYVAERGSGAYLNGSRIHVSKVGNLRESYVFYCEGGEKNRARTGRILGRVYPEVTDIRKLGSAGLETAWVAAGKGEAYFTTMIEPWDVAPGVLLVEEAGGTVSDFNGSSWKLETSDLVVSNGQVHSHLQELIDGGTPR
jgi:myo-inositol-1(or 4)-monophosphatase